MTWRLARCLEVLQDEINADYPNRPTQTDGTIAGSAHSVQNPTSDHEPNRYGVVRAWDITTAPFTLDLAEELRMMGAEGDKRIKYVIYRGRIAGPTARGWAWRTYVVPKGGSKHFDHIHLSVSGTPAQYDRSDPWLVHQPAPTPEDDVTPEDIEKVAQRVRALIAKDLAVLLHGTADGTHPANLDNIWAAVKQ